MNELIEFCNKHDCTFNIRYEKCWYTFVIQIWKINRDATQGQETIDGGVETERIAFIRDSDLESGIKKVLIEAEEWIKNI